MKTLPIVESGLDGEKWQFNPETRNNKYEISQEIEERTPRGTNGGRDYVPYLFSQPGTQTNKMTNLKKKSMTH